MTATPSSTLLRDLALVLPDVSSAAMPETAQVRATIRGKDASLDDALAHAASLLHASTAPALIGLTQCSLEAVDAAVSLAQRLGAYLLPWPAGSVIDATRGVSQSCTLEEIFACDFVIRPQPEAGDRSGSEHPVLAAIAEHTLHSLFVQPGLAPVQRLRAAVRERGIEAITETIMKPVKRLAVVLPVDTEPEVTSLWHALAAAVQTQLRVSVFVLPELTTTGNMRGVMEVITWITGLNPIGGGIDFGGEVPRRCNHAGKLLSRGAVDVAVEVCLPAVNLDRSKVKHRIVIGPTADKDADVCLLTPGLVPGLAARVMRCDGAVLWLCDEPKQVPADPCVAVLEKIRA